MAHILFLGPLALLSCSLPPVSLSHTPAVFRASPTGKEEKVVSQGQWK